MDDQIKKEESLKIDQIMLGNILSDNEKDDEYVPERLLLESEKEQIKTENEQTDEKIGLVLEERGKRFLSNHFMSLKPTELSSYHTEIPRPVLEGKKRKNFYDEQKRSAKKAEGIMSEEDIVGLETLRNSKWGKTKWMKESKKGASGNHGEIYDRVVSGDYSDFEHLDVTLRNALASRFMRELFVPPYKSESAEEYVERLQKAGGVSALLNPLFRLGVSLSMRSGFNAIAPEFFRELDSACGSAVMLETITKLPGEVEKEKLLSEYKIKNVPKPEEALDKDVRRNLGSQIFIAKNLLLAQMSDFSKISKDKITGEKVKKDWDSDVSSAFTHCSRVSYILPAVTKEIDNGLKEHEGMWKSLRELKEDDFIGDGLSGNVGGLFKRGASTHGMRRRRVNGSSFSEKKVPFNLKGQEGMNVAIGGLGNSGIQGFGSRKRVLTNDGSCGHIYTMMEKGEEGVCGGYLLGFESDAYKKTNQLGHKHGFGNGEYSSSFGGQRTDEIGEKYGGRVADLSGFNADDIRYKLEVLDEYMRRSAQMGIDTTQTLKPLVGHKMNQTELFEFTDKLVDMNREMLLHDIAKELLV